MQQFISTKELKAFLALGKYKYISLKTPSGKEIIKKNAGGKYQDRENQIIDFLHSASTQAGYYILNCQYALGTEIFEYLFKKGDPQEEAPKIEKPLSEMKDNVLTYEQALKYQNTIAEQKYQILALERENTDLRREIAAYEEEENEQIIDETDHKGLGEIQTGGTLKSVLQIVELLAPTINGITTTVIENNKQKQIESTQQPAQPQAPEIDEEMIKIVNYLKVLKVQEPAAYKEIINSTNIPNNGQENS